MYIAIQQIMPIMPSCGGPWVFGRSFFCLAWISFSSDHPGLLLLTSHPPFALESPVRRRRDRRLSNWKHETTRWNDILYLDIKLYTVFYMGLVIRYKDVKHYGH